MWGQQTVIARDNLVMIHEEHRARDPGFFGHCRDWEETFLHDVVGNLVGWGLRLGVLEEAEWFGAPGYRMVRRDPLFEQMGDGKWRRLDAEACARRAPAARRSARPTGSGTPRRSRPRSPSW